MMTDAQANMSESKQAGTVIHKKSRDDLASASRKLIKKMPSRTSIARFHLPFSGSSTSVHGQHGKTELVAQLSTTRTPSISAFTLPPTAQFDSTEILSSLSSVGNNRYPPSAWASRQSPTSPSSHDSSTSSQPVGKRLNEVTSTYQHATGSGFSGGHNYNIARMEERNRLESLGLLTPSPNTSPTDLRHNGVLATPTTPTTPRGRSRRSSWQAPINGKLRKGRSQSRGEDSGENTGNPRHSFSRVVSQPTSPSDVRVRPMSVQSKSRPISPVDMGQSNTDLASPKSGHDWEMVVPPRITPPDILSPLQAEDQTIQSTDNSSFQHSLTEQSHTESSPVLDQTVAAQSLPIITSSEIVSRLPDLESQQARSSLPPKRYNGLKERKPLPTTSQSRNTTLPVNYRTTSTCYPESVEVAHAHQRSYSSGNAVEIAVKPRNKPLRSPLPPTETQTEIPPVPTMHTLLPPPDHPPPPPPPLSTPASNLVSLKQEAKLSPIIHAREYEVSPITKENGDDIPTIQVSENTHLLPPPIPPRAPGRTSRDSSLVRQPIIPVRVNTSQPEILALDPSMLQIVSHLQRADSIAESDYIAPLSTPSTWLSNLPLFSHKNANQTKTNDKKQAKQEKAAEKEMQRRRQKADSAVKKETNQLKRRLAKEGTSKNNFSNNVSPVDIAGLQGFLYNERNRELEVCYPMSLAMNQESSSSSFADGERSSSLINRPNIRRTSLNVSPSRFSSQSWEKTPTCFMPAKEQEDIRIPPHERPGYKAPPEPLSLAEWKPEPLAFPNFIPTPPFSASRQAQGRSYSIPALKLDTSITTNTSDSSTRTPSVVSSAASSCTSLSSTNVAPLVASSPKVTPTLKKQKQKLFAICCQCDLLHDMHPELHQALVEGEDDVRCTNCTHSMKKDCCERWATVVRFENRLI